MSNNSAVTVEGGEIGRAQAMQARAAGWRPASGSTRSCSSPAATAPRNWWSAAAWPARWRRADYITHRERLAAVVADELASLRAEFDVVICEGAGSPAEINLRATDLANMGLARAGAAAGGGGRRHRPRRGAGASASARSRCSTRRIRHSSRGSWSTSSVAIRRCWRPGCDQLERAHRPAHVRRDPVPATEIWLDAEDSVSVRPGAVGRHPGAAARRRQPLTVAAVRLPRISNSTDVEALACEPGVLVRWVTDAADLRRRRRRGAARQQGHASATWHGCGSAGWPTRYTRTPPAGRPCSGSAAASRCCAAGSTTRWSPGVRRGVDRARPARRRHRVRAGQDAAALGNPVAGLRDSPRPVARFSRGGLARCRHPARRRVTARTGTGCSTTTTAPQLADRGRRGGGPARASSSPTTST